MKAIPHEFPIGTLQKLRLKKKKASAQASTRVIYAALAANIGIAVSKFIVASISGSPAMLTEGIHSAVDTGNELLLLLGAKLSQKPADQWHPFGYGKVMYFWALIVALSVFSMGGGVSIYQGILSLQNPPPLQDPTWNYVVLIVAGLFEGYSWRVSRRELSGRRHKKESLLKAFRRSKDASVITVFIEDSAALIGIAVAILGIWLGHYFHNPRIDPAASILIGLVLVVAAFLLAQETGALLIGESIDREQVERLREIISCDPMVETVGELLTMQLGPHSILLAAAVRFKRGLKIEDVDNAIARLNQAIQTNDSSIQRIFFDSEPLISALKPLSE